MFIMERSDQGTLYYARRTGDLYSDGWYTPADLFDGTEAGVEPQIKDGWELVTVTLPRDVASALADAILTETTGIAPTDVRVLRQDLAHERDRRDRLEDVLVGMLQAHTGPVTIVERP